MKKAVLLILLTLLSAGLFGQSGLTGRCKNGGTYPNCVGGEIIFSGTGYAASVHVTVNNSAGDEIDDADYTTTAGALSFTENLSFADTYSIYLDQKLTLTVNTN
jgi:hypothetical protein